MKKYVFAAAIGLSLAGCSRTSCVASGTRVRTPDGWRPIEALDVGDAVLAFDEVTGEQFVTKVTAVTSAMREVGSVSLGGIELRMTPDHPVYCPRQRVYAPAGDWFLGHRTTLAILGDDGFEEVEVDEARTFVGVAQVFDITVEHERHNFVADGVLVHNKSPVCDQRQCTCPDGRTFTSDCSGACDCSDAGRDDAGPSDMSSGNNRLDMTSEDTGSGSDASDMQADVSDASSDGGADMSVQLRKRGFCETDDDCPDTTACITIPANDPGGFKACQAEEAAEPGCGQIEPPDQCCVHADCTDDPSGTCIRGPIFYCGGIAPTPANVCMYDECASDEDCGGAPGSCLPPRVLGEPVSRCVQSQCGNDADCTGGDNGECRAFFNPCNRRLTGFFCTYDESECRTDDDCEPDPDMPGTPYCAPGDGDGNTACGIFQPPP
jgi:hypothetical protein